MATYEYDGKEMYYKYTWSTDNGDNPKQRHPLDSAKFDRDEGYEMLSLVNRISSEMGFTNFLQCRLAEVIAKTKLPTEYSQNRKEAIEWVKKTYSSLKLIPADKNQKLHQRYPNN